MAQHPATGRTPSEQDTLAALAELIGADAAEALWASCARTLGVGRPVNQPAELLSMVDHLMTDAELARVGARSVKVRVITHQAIAGSVLT